MARPQHLYFYEQILLLAVQPDQGTIVSGFSDFAIAGGVIADLAALERIDIGRGRRKRVAMVSTQATGDPVLDTCLARIGTGWQQVKLKKCIPQLAKIKHLRHRAVNQLVAREVLEVGRESVLGLFKKDVFSEIDRKPLADIFERLNQAIFSENLVVDANTQLLISLANGSNLLGEIFAKRDLRRRKKRIRQLTDGEPIGKAIKDVLAAEQAARSAVITATGAAASAATNS